MVTRAAAQAAGFGARLRAQGADPVFFPTIEVAPPEDPRPLLDAAIRIRAFDVVVFGSINAAGALAAALEQVGGIARARLACVGARTAEKIEAQSELRALLAGPLWSPSVFRAEALADELAADLASTGGIAGRRILHPHAAQSRDIVGPRLRALGAIVEEVEAYRISARAPASAAERAELDGVDAYTFLSGETLANFVEIMPEAEARRRLEQAVVAVIGPVAGDRAAQLGVRVDVVPPAATTDALVAALAEHLGPAAGREG